MQSQSMQYCLMTLAPQQSPPSNMQKGLLFTSSHESSEIQISSPPASTEIISSFEIKNLIAYQKLKVYCSLLLQTELSLGIPVVVRSETHLRYQGVARFKRIMRSKERSKLITCCS